jgi:hypothetical protein
MAHSIREFSIKNFQLVRDKMRRKQKKNEMCTAYNQSDSVMRNN